jgi:hypothetical protein
MSTLLSQEPTCQPGSMLAILNVIAKFVSFYLDGPWASHVPFELTFQIKTFL